MIQNLRSSVLAILARYDGKYNGSLEAYLLSLWTAIGKHKDEPPTYLLFSILIAEAFETNPCPFETQWLAFEKLLFWDYQDGAYVIKVFQNGEWTVANGNADDFELLRHTILCQIADLHRMSPQELDDPYRYFGIDSPTGNRWYNFDLFPYWECATRGMEDHLRSDRSLIASRFAVCTWATFATLLELGQSYE